MKLYMLDKGEPQDAKPSNSQKKKGDIIRP